VGRRRRRQAMSRREVVRFRGRTSDSRRSEPATGSRRARSANGPFVSAGQGRSTKRFRR
jgi:hypothetical protein